MAHLRRPTPQKAWKGHRLFYPSGVAVCAGRTLGIAIVPAALRQAFVVPCRAIPVALAEVIVYLYLASVLQRHARHMIPCTWRAEQIGSGQPLEQHSVLA